jgi:deoxyadenosine/deoxycytidine kinase
VEAFRYIAIEGPLGVGKAALADRLGARLDAAMVLDEGENPFLADFYGGRPGAAFQTQLFFTLARHRQQAALRQSDLFSQVTVCDYLFERDKIYAYLNLDDNELFIYQRLYDLLARDIPAPDLVVYLQAPPDVLMDRVRRRGIPSEQHISSDYLAALSNAYTRFFHFYDDAPLLIINAAEIDFANNDDHFLALVARIQHMSGTRQYFNPHPILI